jgi:hypothetical protein
MAVFTNPVFGRIALGVGVGMPFHSLQNPEKPSSVLGQPHHPLVFSPGATMNTDPSRSTRSERPISIPLFSVLRFGSWSNGPGGYEVNKRGKKALQPTIQGRSLGFQSRAMNTSRFQFKHANMQSLPWFERCQ